MLGDGKLGILCAWVLSTACESVTLVGRHDDKLQLAARDGLSVTTDAASVPPADIVVEATGRAAGFEQVRVLSGGDPRPRTQTRDRGPGMTAVTH